MSRYIRNDKDISLMFDAVLYWKNECLLKESSIFSNSKLWTIKNMELLKRLYVDNPDLSDKNFFDKLESQLGREYPEVICLVAEMLWILFLPSENIGVETKQNSIMRLWQWAGKELSFRNKYLTEEILSGFAHTGIGYNTNRWRELSYFITIMNLFLSFPLSKRIELLNNEYLFVDWLDGISESQNRQFRHILTFLLFPDVFEPITCTRHKQEIVNVLGNLNKIKATIKELDQELILIREEQSKILGKTNFSFYLSPLVEQWKNKKDHRIERDTRKELKRVQEINDDKTINKIIKKHMIQARDGHGKYKKELAKVETKCRITEIADTRFLTASHIKPWRDCRTQNECLDGYNGLWFAPHIDRLFDHGWISFNNDGDLLCSQDIEDILLCWQIHLPVNIGQLHDKQKEYMEYHRKHIYKN